MTPEMDIILPENIRELLESGIFDLDQVNDNLLTKFLFFVPEVQRIFGLKVASLKQKKRSIEHQIYVIENVEMKNVESRILMDIAYDIDSQRFKNEQMRTAKVMSMPQYIEVVDKLLAKKKELGEVESEIDEYMEYVWKFKNLMQSLDNISKLRISERRY